MTESPIEWLEDQHDQMQEYLTEMHTVHELIDFDWERFHNAEEKLRNLPYYGMFKQNSFHSGIASFKNPEEDRESGSWRMIHTYWGTNCDSTHGLNKVMCPCEKCWNYEWL